MTPQYPTILIIGGPDKSKCYSERGITRVAYHPLDVLQLGHLYDYDIAILWPPTLLPIDFKFNLTKGELGKVVDNYSSSPFSKETNNNKRGPSVTDKTPHPDRKKTKTTSLSLKSFINNHFSLFIDYFNSATDNPRKIFKLSTLLKHPRLLYLTVPPWFVRNISKYTPAFHRRHRDNEDSGKLVDDNDKKKILEMYNNKLYDIVLGVANMQLAFYIAPNIEPIGQNLEILKWIHFSVEVKSDTVIKFYFTPPPEPSQHSIITILSELGSIIKEWKYVFIPPRHRDRSVEDLIFWSGNPLHKSLSISPCHTDGERRARSLMILSEKGGLALIPEPISIDSLVGLIQESLKKTAIAPADSADMANVDPAQATEKLPIDRELIEGLRKEKGPTSLDIAADLSTLSTLTTVDREMAVVKARKILEIILQTSCKCVDIPIGTKNLNRLREDLDKPHHIPSDINCHCQTIINFGNFAAHERGGEECNYRCISDIELKIVVKSLMVVCRWYLEKILPKIATKKRATDILKPKSIDDVAGIISESLKKTKSAPSDPVVIANVQPAQATEKPFLSMFNVRPETFKWEDVIVAYNPDTKRIGFIYSGRPSSQYYINELPGIGSKKQNDKLTQPGELLHNILANKHRFYEIKEIASIIKIPSSSVKFVVHSLNKALIKLFFCSTEDIPAITHSKEADSYTVGFTIMDQWNSARKEESSDEHDSTSDEPELDQEEKNKYARDHGSDALPYK